ncbi:MULTISPECIES: phosphoglycerate kinase [Roseivirga]|jgi:phosphoglycerate kinase|uniref:Phosphoglycerate kinase n=1 Tax=Roseivirga spongicola TaxID=333140 RepID=A0A150X8Z6_9BACT|nr:MULTISPECIES: phosphoglycerate kinase [Roseivirga]KYG75160.1 phosphoglycerate kinase [Roseivirga spongicola]MBO6496118.1 phosphoglycerate kinase [Roseivirga sp.]MBO6662054.1 phosphoglycerate kinase [Roseivirga sp.]MBO6909357.1 phosphoglycerate kinase [Roseivirga sp.]WPZ12355.1 phosphoglycerate kinase [Roseivirga spongicola]
MKTINDFDFSGKKALIRVDFNVPLDSDFNITDDTRIKAAVPTIQKILDEGGAVVLMSHLGRPKEGPEDKFSLKHLVSHLSQVFNREVKFADDCVGEEANKLSSTLESGDILLLENLRFYKEETAGDEDFAKKLSSHGDIYINDAFGTAHRAHASTSIIAQFFEQKGCGFVMQAELDNAQKVLDNAQKPYTAIMGGAKISDKILIIERLLEKVDNLVIGGGMAYTFFKAMGGNIGSSLLEEDKLDLAKELIKKAKELGVNLMLPIDSVIADAFSNDANTQICLNVSIPEGWMGLDIGPEAAQVFSNSVKESKTILWNGPMGVFEMEKFSSGTKAVAEAIVEATKGGAFSLIGGGDSAAAVNTLGYGNDVSYVSTGGGALLEYMEGKELPGVAALED